MGVTPFPNGVSSFGVPVLPAAGGSVFPTTGNVWFVDSGSGNAGNDGKTPTTAFALIDTAYNAGHVVADNGDVIYVMPGHSEDIAAATSLVIDKAATSIIGLGHGHNRPILDFSATASSVEIDAANTRISNIVFRSSVSACVVGVNVDAHDCEIDHCEFTWEDTGDEFLMTIDVSSFDRCNIHDCVFNAQDSVAGATTGIRLTDALNTKIVNNLFDGGFETAMIYSKTTASTNLYIAGNRGRNDSLTAGRSLYLTKDDTGHIEGNRFTTAYTGPVDDTFDPGLCGCVDNKVSRESGNGLSNDGGEFSVPFSGVDAGWHVAYCDATAFAGGTTNARGANAETNDPMPIFQVKGAVECMVVGLCGTALAGTNAFLSVGVTGATGLCVAKILVTGIEPGCAVSGNALTATGISMTAGGFEIIYGGTKKTISEHVYTDITGGYMDYVCKWRPLIKGSNVTPSTPI